MVPAPEGLNQVILRKLEDLIELRNGKKFAVCLNL